MQAVLFHVKRFALSPPISFVALPADTPPGFPLPRGKDRAWSSRAIFLLPLPLAGEGRGGGAQQTKSEMGPKKNEPPCFT